MPIPLPGWRSSTSPIPCTKKPREYATASKPHNARFVVTDYVIVEIANALSRIPFRESAVHLINSMTASRNIELVEIDKEVYREAWELYSGRTDKEWSLTDCTSFIIMNRSRITEAFTSDRHFEQSGFTILLKE